MLTQGTRVLITGGAGFIGAHVARALAARAATVRVLDDLSTGRRDGSRPRRHRLSAGRRAQSRGGQRAMQGVERGHPPRRVQPGVDPIARQEVNLGGTLHILNSARDVDKRARPRVVLCGSASVYGKQTGFVLHEELPPRPTTPEAVMALAMEQYGRVYREAYGVPVVNLRLFRTFGPDEDAERTDAGIVATFIRAALDGKLAGHLRRRPADARSHLRRQRGRRHARRARGRGSAGRAAQHRLGRSGRRSTSCGTWCSRAAARSAWPSTRPTCRRRRGSPSTRARRSRAPARSLGWAPAVRLREGLARTVEHYQAQRNADPNAWFAPKDEPAPKKKLTLPKSRCRRAASARS